ncbi:hypothetical protein ACG02S_12865 [Roseateles sp. DC23W]|uniref:Uncharacterized protein n=1 Tax=Pelomonas dachongensis TaxID=3299029 RepID=A0ABW7EMR9_9BURK
MATKTQPTNIFYVKAVPDKDDPQRAKCTFFTDFDCKYKVKPPLSIPQSAGEAVFVHAPSAANWLLVGAVADRVDTTIVDPSFLPATFNQVSIPMPRTEVITQGVLLIFSSQGTTTQLFSSADPVIRNNDA